MSTIPQHDASVSYSAVLCCVVQILRQRATSNENLMKHRTQSGDRVEVASPNLIFSFTLLAQTGAGTLTHGSRRGSQN